MQIKVDSDKLRQWRKERFLSQEQAAEQAGIGLRTIQRIENGGVASLDSATSLATLFDVNIDDFALNEEKQREKAYEDKQAKGLLALKMSFGIHALGFVIGAVTMLFIDIVDSPGYWWTVWPLGFWSIGFLAHGATVYLVQYLSKMQGAIQDLESA